MRALSRNEIEAALLEDEMATIFPPANGVSYNREEQLANTDPVYPPREAPYTPTQLDELRAKAAQNPHSHNAQAAVVIAERQARQKAHDDKLRAKLDAATAAKGAPLTFEERQVILRSV
jgi:hypothetical protein